MANAEDLIQLKASLAQLLPGQFRDANHLRKPEGIPTGFSTLDQFLPSGGIPKGALSLVAGALGTGGTSLWIESAFHAVQKGRWVAWVGGDVPLMPVSLQQRGIHLGHFVTVEPNNSQEPDRLFWLLQELMSSRLFDLIGCDLGTTRLQVHQLRKLQTQARQAHLALTFLTRELPPPGTISALFALILKFEKRRIVIARALHRSTPHSFPRSVSYDRFTNHVTHPSIHPPTGLESRSSVSTPAGKGLPARHDGFTKSDDSNFEPHSLP